MTTPTNRTWVISDTHLGHKNIVVYEPMRKAWGEDARVMTETMIYAWQDRVKSTDTVIHVGDFAFGTVEVRSEFRRRLPGKLILVLGNHDTSVVNVKKWIKDEDEVHPRYKVQHGDGFVQFIHNPSDYTLADANNSVLLVHGHTHSSKYRHMVPEVDAKLRCACVEMLPGPGPMLLDEFLNRDRDVPFPEMARLERVRAAM